MSGASVNDPVILNYHESLLRESDISILRGPYWLNDNIISFYFEYLTKMFEDAATLLFVSPEVTQCIKITPITQIGIFLDPLQFDYKNFIFFALNDNEAAQFAGGTHWSLLVFSRKENCIFHYDSLNSDSQNEQAYNLASKLFLYAGLEGSFQQKGCARQTNGYDCGIHVICNAEYLANWILNHGMVGTSNLACTSIARDVNSKRLDILNVINDLKTRFR